jgi:hypothetical protein
MRYVVLDTDVASRAIKDQLGDPLATRLTGTAWCVTFVTVGGLWQWRPHAAGDRVLVSNWSNGAAGPVDLVDQPAAVEGGDDTEVPDVVAGKVLEHKWSLPLRAHRVADGFDAAVGGHSAVDRDLGAGNKRGMLAEQERDQRRDIVGGASAAQGGSARLAALNAGAAEAVIGVSM